MNAGEAIRAGKLLADAHKNVDAARGRLANALGKLNLVTEEIRSAESELATATKALKELCE